MIMMIPRLGLTRFSKLNSTVASNVAWKQSVPLSTTTKPLPIAATMVKWNKCLKNDWLSRSNKSLAFFSTKIDSKEKQSKNVSKSKPEVISEDVKSKKSFSELSNRIYTLPNILCLMRIGVTPVVSYCIIAESYQYALALCAFSSITDYLDGWIARKFHVESKLGAVLDPLADKLLVVTLTLTLAYMHLLPLWLTSLIILRDLLIVAGGIYLQFKHIQPPFTWSKYFDISKFQSDRFKPTLISKVNTGFQLSLMLVTLSAPIFTSFYYQYPLLLPGVQLATGITTLWSGLNYLTRLK